MSVSGLPAAALIASLLFAGAGDGTFRAPLLLPASDAVDVAAGDMDGDGKTDLAFADGMGVGIFLHGPGAREWVEGPRTPAGNAPFSLLTADIDGDGRDEVVACDPGTVAWLLRLGAGGAFDAPVSLPEAQQARAAAAGDLDGDGILDLAIACYMLKKVVLYRGTGDGSVSFVKEVSTSGKAHDLAVLDADEDGRDDLAVGLGFDGVLLLLGRKEFAMDEKLFRIAGHQIQAADFDGDGRLDLACWSVSSTTQQHSILANRGKGDFDTVKLDYRPSGFASDVDGDGRADLVIERWVLPGNGDFTFGPPVDFGGTNAFLVRDLDGDSRPDLAATGLKILWGSAGPGLVEKSVRLAVDAEISSSPGVADLDGNGLPDIFLPGTGPEVPVLLDPGIGGQATKATVRPSKRLFSLQVADLDSNGVPDLAGMEEGLEQVIVALLDRAGGVRSEAIAPLGFLPSGLAVGCLDGDNLPDLAAYGAGATGIAVLRNAGDGSLTDGVWVPPIDGLQGLTIADLDRDGFGDLLAWSKRAVAAFPGLPGWRFGDPVLLEVPGDQVLTGAVAGDVDGDGFPEVVANAETTETGRSLEIYRWPQAGHARSIPIPIQPSSLALADVDSDGLLEIIPAGFPGFALVHIPGDSVTVYEAYSSSLAIADFDLDGALDVLTFILNPNVASIVFGRRAPEAFVRGDGDGDRILDLADAVIVLRRLFLGGDPLPCDGAADSTDDGVLDLADPIALLRSLFLGEMPLPPPGPACGPDPTPDAIDCWNDCR
jgi:hypothetical protein